MNKIKTLLTIIGALAVACLAGPGTVHAQQKKPNIIIILADDMGYGDLALYGHPHIRTKNLNKMAEEGLRLTSFCEAASSCTPSRAALMTGRYPLRSGLPEVILPQSEKGLHATEITIADVLKAQGYKTMCIGKWHLGQAKKEYLPLAHGFDHYYGVITSVDMRAPWVKTDIDLRIWKDNEPAEEFPIAFETLTTRYTDQAIRFIKSAGKSPFFLYLPHSMPHVPLYPGKDFKGKSDGGLYGDVIESLDWSVGEILKTLKEENLDKNTIVIFTSDNGPWNNMPDRMFKEDIVKPWDGGSAGLLRGGKGTSYEGGFRVPFIIRWPGTIPARQTSSQFVTSLDLYITLANIAGGRVPKDREMDGEDVLPVFMGDRSFTREKDFYYYQGIRLEGIRSGDWKLRISKITGKGLPPNDALAPELYNLRLDPAEQFNRAEEFPDLVKELKQKMLNKELKGSVKEFN